MIKYEPVAAANNEAEERDEAEDALQPAASSSTDASEAPQPSTCFDYRSASFYRVACVVGVLVVLLLVNLVAISRLALLVRQLHNAPSRPRPSYSSAYYPSNTSSNSTVLLPLPRFRVGVYTVGLGLSYFQLALDFVSSGQRYLCADRPDVLIEYFVFTNHEWKDAAGGVWQADMDRDVDSSNVHLLAQSKRGWPYDSDLRYEFMDNHTDAMAAEVEREGGAAFAQSPIAFTHYVWSDADNHFVAPVCEELLSELVATQHPHIFTGCDAPYPYEDRPESKAHVPRTMQRLFPYFTAHLYSGTATRFKHLVNTLAENTRIDRANNIQAKVDDESHLQAYLVEHIPTNVLSRAFAWPEDKDNMDDDARHMLDLVRLGGMRCLSAHSKLKKRDQV